MRLALALAAMLAPVAVACTSAPSDPTYTRDVAPILQANCIKCHGRVARGGAPSTFRLDVFFGVGATAGAVAMSQYIAERTHRETMPPIAPLADVQIETLSNWYANGAPLGDPDPDNRPPQIQIEGFSGAETLTLPYLISDEDFDVVTGQLIATPVGGGGGAPITITGDLHSGVGEATWFVAAERAGDYEISARLSDGHVVRGFDLGRTRITHASGNTAPKLVFAPLDPSRPLLVNDADLPLPIEFAIFDEEAADTADVTIALVRGSERVELATAADLGVGNHVIDIDTSAVPAGPNWSLVLSAGPSSATIGQVIVSHSTTDLRYADVQATYGAFCTPCHNFGASYSEVASSGLGPAYLRVALEQSMPLRSAETLFDRERFPADDRARLAEWLLAGAPEL